MIFILHQISNYFRIKKYIYINLYLLLLDYNIITQNVKKKNIPIVKMKIESNKLSVRFKCITYSSREQEYCLLN